MKRILIGATALMISACSMYQSEFDSPACKGIGCKSVSDVMELIVERKEKQDLFVPDEDDARILKERQRR